MMEMDSSDWLGRRSLDTGNRMLGDRLKVAASPFSVTMSGGDATTINGVTSPCKYNGVSEGVGDVETVVDTVTLAVTVADADVDGDVVMVPDTEAVTVTVDDTLRVSVGDADTVADTLRDADVLPVAVADTEVVGDTDSDTVVLPDRVADTVADDESVTVADVVVEGLGVLVVVPLRL